MHDVAQSVSEMLSDSEAAWIESYLKPRHPDLVDSYLEARRVVAATRSSGSLTLQDAHRLLVMASNRRKPLGENVAGMLGELAADFPEARRALESLATHHDGHCRINALGALESFSPGPFHVEMIGRALRDKSTKVRALAASKAMTFGLKALIAEIDQALEREQDGKLKIELKANRDLLEHGYICEIQADGDLWVTCRTRGGTATAFFKAEEFESKARQWMAEHQTQLNR